MDFSTVIRYNDSYCISLRYCNWHVFGVANGKMIADWHANKGEDQMKKILDIITDEMKKAFAANGYDENFAKVTSVQPPGSLRIPVQRRDGSRKDI